MKNTPGNKLNIPTPLVKLFKSFVNECEIDDGQDVILEETVIEEAKYNINFINEKHHDYSNFSPKVS